LVRFDSSGQCNGEIMSNVQAPSNLSCRRR
jgi:hypothetical protein